MHQEIFYLLFVGYCQIPWRYTFFIFTLTCCSNILFSSSHKQCQTNYLCQQQYNSHSSTLNLPPYCLQVHKRFLELYFRLLILLFCRQDYHLKHNLKYNPITEHILFCVFSLLVILDTYIMN